KYKAFEEAHFMLLNHISGQSFISDLFGFMPSVRRRKAIRASILIKRMIKGIPPEKIWDDIDILKASLQDKMKALKVQIEKHKMRLEKANALLNKQRFARDAVNTAYAKVYGNDDAKIHRSLENAGIMADNTIRLNLFRIATHYWEGRWLLEVDGKEEKLLREKISMGHGALIARWRRRMMLTPCAVSTFFMLPAELRVDIDGNSNRHTYLYNFIDLLIVDEAGQVLPEIGAASFALAKKALVVGDTLQIEPIWNIPKSIDIGNLVYYGLLPKNPSREDVELVMSTGI